MKITYNQSDNSLWEDLRRAAQDRFAEKELTQPGDWRLYVKSAILIPSAIIIYLCIFFAPIHGWMQLGLCALLGINFALIGFNVMHDAAHGSYSWKKWINYIMALTLEMMGNSGFMWRQKHNILHHTYTNVRGHDNDIDVGDLLRFSREQRLRKIHKYQHIYASVLYSLQYLQWVWYTDYKKYFTWKISGHTIRKAELKDHITFWSGKVFHFVFMVIIPIYHFGVVDFLIGYGVFAGVCGLIISFVFQLAHIVEGRDFPIPNENGVIDGSWARMQVETTSNFATNSTVANQLLGGLNFQIEHHLFPKISHVHYRMLSPVVEQVCKEYGIVYSKPPLGRALRLHFHLLKKMGREE